MVKQSVSIVNFQILYNILYEVKEILRFEVINFEKEQDFIEDKTNKLENNLIIFGPNINFSLFQDRVDTRKVFVAEKFPIDLKKLIENINIQLIKQKYGYQSNIRLKNYTLDLNSRFITSENKNLKLTEREIDIILFLNEHDVPKNVINLQKEVLQKTDSIFSKYLIGSKEGQYVKIENRFSPIYSDNTYRGLWKLEGGFMGGPFLIKTYFFNKKVVVTVGLIFAPNDRKRNYIRNLEAIL